MDLGNETIGQQRCADRQRARRLGIDSARSYGDLRSDGPHGDHERERVAEVIEHEQATREKSRSRPVDVETYLSLVRSGAIAEDDRVELLDGLVVSEPPQEPEHAACSGIIAAALRAAVGTSAAVREQSPLVLGAFSSPEPDVAVVEGKLADYCDHHPTGALLVVEVAKSSLAKDRISKSRIYAAAGIPEYWVVNLRSRQVEIFREPHAEKSLYASRSVAERGASIELVALAPTKVSVAELLPP